MKKQSNTISKIFTEYQNEDGKCAMEAIGFVFKLDLVALKAVLRSIGWRPSKDGGLTFRECGKAIRFLGTIHLKTVKYFKNKRPKKYRLKQFLYRHRHGTFILNQEGHLSVVKGGKSYDNHSPESFDILGWWEIKPKYPTPAICNPCKYHAIFDAGIRKITHRSLLNLPPLDRRHEVKPRA